MSYEMADAGSQWEDEVRHIVGFVEEKTGLPSRWNGSVRIVDARTASVLSAVPFFARKDWDCGITILDVTLESSLRWRTLLHEAIHSVSVGLTRQNYEPFRLWEEAVVESLQRFYRPALVESLGLDLAEQPFLDAEAMWRYNSAVEALHQIADEVPAVSAHDFLRQLISVPLPDRKAFVLQWGRKNAADFMRFKRVYAASCGILR